MRALRPVWRWLAAGAWAASVPAATAFAAEPTEEELARLSLEQLANVDVTSVSRRIERLSDVAASVFVITAEDIRRSGAATLTEALRLAPNLAVARADANQYAITSRAFNGILANKLLVMIDGRTVYSPLFSGAFWDAQDVLMEDIERIEVISGPGGTLWGTNAVHGVIHIITRPAEGTLGALVAASAGTTLSRAAARYGTTLGETGAARVYGQYTDQQGTEFEHGPAIGDQSNRAQGGFRADWGWGKERFTLSGDAYHTDINEAVARGEFAGGDVPGRREASGANVLGSWSRAQGDGRDFRMQVFFDHTERFEAGLIRDVLNTWDLELQRTFRPAERLDVLAGAGYRYQDDRLTNLDPSTVAFIPANRVLRIGALFAQGDFQVRNNLDVSVGLKLEHNIYTDREFLPNVRLGWKATGSALLWAEVARAVRAPARLDREAFVPGIPPFVIAGGPDFDSEISNVFEIGWRAQPRTALSYSVTAFHHDLGRLRSLAASPDGFVFVNDIEGTLDGIEAWGSYRVRPWWRIAASLVEQRLSLNTLPGISDFSGLAALGNDPNVYAKLRLSFDLSHALDLDLMLRHYGKLPHPEVPEYTEVDARLGWWAWPGLELSVAGSNLLAPSHPEWGPSVDRAAIERAFVAKLEWRP